MSCVCRLGLLRHRSTRRAYPRRGSHHSPRGRRRSAVPAAGVPRAWATACLDRLGDVRGIEHPAGRLLGHLGDIGETLARVRIARRFLQRAVSRAGAVGRATGASWPMRWKTFRAVEAVRSCAAGAAAGRRLPGRTSNSASSSGVRPRWPCRPPQRASSTDRRQDGPPAAAAMLSNSA